MTNIKRPIDLVTRQNTAETATSRQSRLQEDTYFRLMRILQDNPQVSQRELAEKLGISLGGINYCIKALVDKGFVKLGNFQNSKQKLKYVYILTPAGIAKKVSMTNSFLQRKMEEYELLQEEIAMLKREVAEDCSISAER